jgi:hypothetical protein
VVQVDQELVQAVLWGLHGHLLVPAGSAHHTHSEGTTQAFIAQAKKGTRLKLPSPPALSHALALKQTCP